MARQKKIIDASIVVKWFIEEPDSNVAMNLRSEHITGNVLLIAPDLIFLEVLNVLRYKKQNQKQLNEVTNLLYNIQLHIEHTNGFLLDKAVELALKYDLSIYDALYAAVAQMHGCPLVTEDKKLGKLPGAVSL